MKNFDFFSKSWFSIFIFFSIFIEISSKIENHDFEKNRNFRKFSKFFKKCQKNRKFQVEISEIIFLNEFFMDLVDFFLKSFRIFRRRRRNRPELTKTQPLRRRSKKTHWVIFEKLQWHESRYLDSNSVGGSTWHTAIMLLRMVMCFASIPLRLEDIGAMLFSSTDPWQDVRLVSHSTKFEHGICRFCSNMVAGCTNRVYPFPVICWGVQTGYSASVGKYYIDL